MSISTHSTQTPYDRQRDLALVKFILLSWSQGRNSVSVQELMDTSGFSKEAIIKKMAKLRKSGVIFSRTGGGAFAHDPLHELHNPSGYFFVRESDLKREPDLKAGDKLTLFDPQVVADVFRIPSQELVGIMDEVSHFLPFTEEVKREMKGMKLR